VGRRRADPELRDGEAWVRPAFGYADPAAHWCQRLDDGLGHFLGLVITKAVYGQLAAGVPPPDVVRQVALFGIQNCDGWGVGLTILAALGNLLPVLPEEETYLALFHGARRVAADCDGQAPRRWRAVLASRPDLATLKRWLRRWTTVRHREAARAHFAHRRRRRRLTSHARRPPACGQHGPRVRRR